MEAAAACVPVTDASPVPSQGAAGCQSAGDGSTCWPQDTTGFSPNWVPPVGAHLGVCTAAQISDYYTACQGSASTTQTCDTWKSANGNCSNCVTTPSTGSPYGALVDYVTIGGTGNGGVVYINVGGCLAAAEPCNKPCAAAELAEIQCYNAACSNTVCGDYDSYNACSVEAQSCTDCSDFVNAVNNCEAALIGAASQHPSVALCDVGNTTDDFQTWFTKVATFMCGP
jgi:hypothetical protein